MALVTKFIRVMCYSIKALRSPFWVICGNWTLKKNNFFYQKLSIVMGWSAYLNKLMTTSLSIFLALASKGAATTMSFIEILFPILLLFMICLIISMGMQFQKFMLLRRALRSGPVIISINEVFVAAFIITEHERLSTKPKRYKWFCFKTGPRSFT